MYTTAPALPASNRESAQGPLRDILRNPTDRAMPLSGVSCLLVQDHECAAAHAVVLERAGAAIGRVRTVSDALVAVEGSPWSLVVVDPTLPDGSGYEVVAFAAVTCIDTAFVILTEAGRRPPSTGPFERAFTILERDHTADRLVACAETALARTRLREIILSGAETTRPPSGCPVNGFSSRYQLTSRQQQVLTLLVAGAAPKEIARNLALSPVTVRRHSEDIYRKCGVSNQRGLLALVARSNMWTRFESGRR